MDPGTLSPRLFASSFPIAPLYRLTNPARASPVENPPSPAPPPPAAGIPPGRRPAPPKENLWINILCNVVLPGYLLSQLSKEGRLGPVWGLVCALAVPVGYGLWDLYQRRTWNVLSILGFISVLLTGVLGLMKANALWIAVKEAAIPLLIGVAIPISLRTRQPLVRSLLYNDQVLDTARIQEALAVRQNVGAFERLLVRASWILSTSFLGSAALNFGLARWLLTAAPGTGEFNAQLGRMNWLSWPVIVVPMMAVMFYALFGLIKGIERLTGLKGEDLFHPHARTGQKGQA